MKAVLLLSGGLDSILVAKLLQKEGIEVLPIFCYSPFWKSSTAIEAAKKLGLSLRIIDISDKIWEAVKNPRYGRGQGVNPCIDCKIIMLKEAKRYMEEVGAKFVATGEVLGERPMSQRKNIMEIIAQESGLGDLLVRPLSAKLLTPTLPEKEGWINREKLLDIEGRSRKRQLELAKEWNIDFFPSPAGGCILTDPCFARRAKDLLKNNPYADLNDAELLKHGRHFRLGPKVKLIVGRDREENEALIKLSKHSDILITALDFPGPIGLLRGDPITTDMLNLACGIVLRYSDAPKDFIGGVRIWNEDRETVLMTRKLSDEEIRSLMI